MGNGQVSPGDVGRNYFDYGQIRKCNNFLEKIDLITMDASKKERYIAEARFLRAYDYFLKMQFYGDVPLIKQTIANSEEAKLPRDPKSAIVDFILAELGEIADKLPVQNMRESMGHITSGSAWALKSRVELYEGKYQDAMASAKKVMDMGVYELFPDYRGLFLIENEGLNKESVLEVQYVQDVYPNETWQYILPSLEGGWSDQAVTQNLVDNYETLDGKTIDDPTSGYDTEHPFENRDPRLGKTVLYSGAYFNGRYFSSIDAASPDYYQLPTGPKTGYNVLKYSQPVTADLFSNGGNNVMVIRLAEVLLNYAEAAIEANMLTDEMYDALDAVRQRAGMPVVNRAQYDTQAELREFVRRERRVELAFEGLRYWDIKRWNIGATALNGPVWGSRLGSVNPTTGAVTWTSDRIKPEDRIFHADRNYLMPIPQSEMDANPNIEQNAGY